MPSITWTIAPEPVGCADAAELHRAYIEDIVGRYYGRPATREEIDQELAGTPASDLVPPRGVLLIARESGDSAGCAGVRLCSPGVAELKRVWVRPESRRLGLGARLLAAAEEAAAELGAAALRLDTRSDLTEARRLYARHGYREIPPYHDGLYADHFFEKRLG